MKLFLAIFAYFPYVLAGVKAVQDVVGDSIPGTSKKELVLNSIKAAASVGEQIPESHVQGISSLIDSTVASLKASGVFKPSTPPAVPVAA